jgi:hypothetical protein
VLVLVAVMVVVIMRVIVVVEVWRGIVGHVWYPTGLTTEAKWGAARGHPHPATARRLVLQVSQRCARVTHIA